MPAPGCHRASVAEAVGAHHTACTALSWQAGRSRDSGQFSICSLSLGTQVSQEAAFLTDVRFHSLLTRRSRQRLTP